MIGKYQLKAKAVQAIDADSPVAQAAEIAAMVGAKAFIVDVVSKTARFSGIEGRQDFEVRPGEVVSVMAGFISVMQRSEFNGMFEPYQEAEPELPQ